MLPGGIAPASIALVAVEPSDDESTLFDVERGSLARAVPKRRRDFVSGRQAARAALGVLGQPPVAIPVDPDRAPVWPPAFVGSIAHCEGLAAAAVARSRELAGVGLDVEVRAALPAELHALVITDAERAWLPADPDVTAPSAPPWSRLVFALKEAIFKCLHPRHGAPLEFADVDLAATPAELAQGRARAARIVGVPTDIATRVELRFGVTATHVVALAWVAA